MKKLSAILLLITVNFCFAQYMIIGKDSIALANFKKDNLYGLQNVGVDKTLKATEDFYLLQQFAQEKKADTTAAFRDLMAQKESDLRTKLFLPTPVIDPLLKKYVDDNKTEKKVLIFLIDLKPEDKTDYHAVYNDVKTGKMTMEGAMKKYMNKDGKPFYVKPGSMDNDMYAEIQTLPKNAFTKLYSTPQVVAFAQLLDTRSSLGYLIFGTISYPNDANATKMKTDIYNALKSGKKFPEVAKLYGSSDAEKENGGLIVGSPTLPDNVYEGLKNKKAGEYTDPILVGNNYFVFNVYSLSPYILDDKNKEFYKSEMMKSRYADLVQKSLIDYLKSQPNYKETAEYLNIQKSYTTLLADKKGTETLFSFSKHKLSVDDLKKLITNKVKDADKLSTEEWKDLLSIINNQFVYNSYAQDFSLRPDVKPEMESTKRNFYSEFIFSSWLKNDLAAHPERLTEFYNKNKSKYIWESRAEGRVAIFDDESLAPSISKEIADVKNWDVLKKKFEGKKNAKNQGVVSFESGDMSETAEVFTKYKVPFKIGVFTSKMAAKTLVIAIDGILPPSQMTEKESEEYLKDGVTEEMLNSILAAQRTKTKITVQPEFINDLEKNFKK